MHDFSDVLMPHSLYLSSSICISSRSPENLIATIIFFGETARIVLNIVKNLFDMEEILMARRARNIYKRKDGRWEGRYIKERVNGKAKYAAVYAILK